MKKSILIVDDDILLTGAFQCLLEHYGFAVLCCDNCPDALKLAEEQDLDVIVMDYHLPGMKGDEICRLLRHHCPDVYIIGCSSEYQKDAFISAGADSFIMKNQLMKNIPQLMQKGNSS